MINPNGTRERHKSCVSLFLSHACKGILQEPQLNSAAQVRKSKDIWDKPAPGKVFIPKITGTLGNQLFKLFCYAEN